MKLFIIRRPYENLSLESAEFFRSSDVYSEDGFVAGLYGVRELLQRPAAVVEEERGGGVGWQDRDQLHCGVG